MRPDMTADLTNSASSKRALRRRQMTREGTNCSPGDAGQSVAGAFSNALH
jgi:hypothetical protein